ncbi:flavodoxin family protein [soil metagenome]
MGTRSLVILSSSRKDSNTKILVQKLFNGLENIEFLDLLDYKINHYHYQGKYAKSDQFLKVIEKVLYFDAIIFATPVYWYAMSGLLKVFFDRLTDIVTIQKPLGSKMKGKNIFLISVGTDPELPPGFEIPFQFTANYFEMNFIDSYYCTTENVKRNLPDTKPFLNNIKSSFIK